MRMLIVLLTSLFIGCAATMNSVTTPPQSSPMLVPYKFHDHVLNHNPQHIQYDYESASMTIVLYDTNRVTMYADGPTIFAKWDSVVGRDGAKEKLPSVQSRVQPIFPELAARAGIEAKLIVKGWLKLDGHLSNVIIAQSGAEIFNRSVLDAVKQWTFKSGDPEQGIPGYWAVLEFDFVFENGHPEVLMPY